MTGTTSNWYAVYALKEVQYRLASRYCGTTNPQGMFFLFLKLPRHKIFSLHFILNNMLTAKHVKMFEIFISLQKSMWALICRYSRQKAYLIHVLPFKALAVIKEPLHDWIIRLLGLISLKKGTTVNEKLIRTETVKATPQRTQNTPKCEIFCGTCLSKLFGIDFYTFP